MSEVQLSNPTHPDSTSPDPLLKSDSFIDPQEKDAAGAETPDANQKDALTEAVKFPPGEVIIAQPISMYSPDGKKVESAPRSAKRRNMEEMAKRPSWLPEDWKIDLRVRSSGASSGMIDRYYYEPTGKRKFRSKNEVMQFLETGSKLKKRPVSDADAMPSATPVSQQKQKKSGGKRKKSDAFDSKTTEAPKLQAHNPESQQKKKKSGGKRKKSDALDAKTTEAPIVDALDAKTTEEAPKFDDLETDATKAPQVDALDTDATEAPQVDSVDTKTTEAAKIEVIEADKAQEV